MKHWKQIVCVLACAIGLLLVPQNTQAQEMPAEQQEEITEDSTEGTVVEEAVATSQQEEGTVNENTAEQSIEEPESSGTDIAEDGSVTEDVVSDETEDVPAAVPEDVPMTIGAEDDRLHSLNLWNADGSHGSGNMTVWKNAAASVQAPQVMYAWIGGDSYSLFCIDYGKVAKTGDAYATQADYDTLNQKQKEAIGYVLGWAQRVQAPRYNGSFNDYGGDVTWDNWRLYNSTQLMIWYYIDKYYEPGMNEGIGWDGVVQTCNAGWGDLAECERIKNIVDNLFTIPSFASKRDVTAPTYRMLYNPSTNQYEVLLQDTNSVCTIDKFIWSGAGLTFTRCNASGAEDAGGAYLKVSSTGTIESGTPLAPTNQFVAQTGNITYIKNQTDAQDLILCTSSRPDPVQAFFKVYTESELQISKQDITGSAELPGATLKVTSPDGATVYDTWVSGTAPHTIHGLSSGTYVLTETIAPNGYATAQNITFTYDAESGTVQTVTMKDELVQGRIRIFKTGDQVVSATEYDSVYGTFQRLTFAQKPLAGVVFGIYRADGTLVAKVTTGAEGYAVTDILPWGDYYIAELETPAGLVNTGDKIYVKLSCPEDYHKAVYTEEVSVANAVGDTEINVYKQGEILNIEDGTYTFGTRPLEGVIFGVYANEDILDYEGKIAIQKDGCIGFIRTGEDGKAALKDALVEGKYYYREVQTLEGYILDDTKHEFTLTLGNEELNTMDVNKENPDVNQLYKTKLQIVKSDSADRDILLAGVEFELYNEKDEFMGIYVTDEKGRIIVDGLPYGSYYFRETKAADGYILDTSKQTFLAEEESQMLEITNERIPDTPKTGDEAPVWLVMAAGILFLFLGRRRRF